MAGDSIAGAVCQHPSARGAAVRPILLCNHPIKAKVGRERLQTAIEAKTKKVGLPDFIDSGPFPYGSRKTRHAQLYNMYILFYS